MSGTTTYREPEIFITEQRDLLGRLIFEGLVYRYTIIGTTTDVYEVWEPRTEQHTSLRKFDGFDGWYGQMGVGGDHKRHTQSENLIMGCISDDELPLVRRDSGRVTVTR